MWFGFVYFSVSFVLCMNDCLSVCVFLVVFTSVNARFLREFCGTYMF